jgi:hypothetical protein
MESTSAGNQRDQIHRTPPLARPQHGQNSRSASAGCTQSVTTTCGTTSTASASASSRFTAGYTLCPSREMMPLSSSRAEESSSINSTRNGTASYFVLAGDRRLCWTSGRRVARSAPGPGAARSTPATRRPRARSARPATRYRDPPGPRREQHRYALGRAVSAVNARSAIPRASARSAARAPDVNPRANPEDDGHWWYRTGSTSVSGIPKSRSRSAVHSSWSHVQHLPLQCSRDASPCSALRNTSLYSNG